MIVTLPRPHRSEVNRHLLHSVTLRKIADDLRTATAPNSIRRIAVDLDWLAERLERATDVGRKRNDGAA